MMRSHGAEQRGIEGTRGDLVPAEMARVMRPGARADRPAAVGRTDDAKRRRE
jgi:hypothetical protein